MTTLYVTIGAIAAFTVKATACIGDVSNADRAMDSAAQELLSMWEGDAAQAFSAEQSQLRGFVKNLVDAVNDYIGTVNQVKKGYEDMMAANEKVFG